MDIGGGKGRKGRGGEGRSRLKERKKDITKPAPNELTANGADEHINM